MAASSSGSARPRDLERARGPRGGSRRCRRAMTLPSRASSVPSPSRTSGLTSTSVASSSTKTFQSVLMTSTAWSATSAGKPVAATISRGLRVVDADLRVDRDLGDGVGVLVGDHLDLDAALDGGDAEVVAVGPVEQEGEVVLLRDVGGGRDQHPVDREALDVHAEDLARLARRPPAGSWASFTPPALPRPPALTWALTTTRPPCCLGGGLGLLGRGDHGAQGDRDAVLGEELLRLVLHQIHVRPTPVRPVRDSRHLGPRALPGNLSHPSPA